MTQPCHKDTTLNQQCCDSEHKKGGKEERNTTVHMRQHTPPQHDSVAQHGTARQQQHGSNAAHTTALLHPQQTRQHKTEEERERYEGNEQREGEQHNTRCQPQSEHGDNTQPTTPAIQQGHRVNDKGDANTQTGTPTFDGRPATQPPFPHHATHHPLCHPPSTMPPPTTNVRGERIEDTPPHKHHRHTPAPTHHTPGKEQRVT
nr:MAG TPA: hypothetical protein [Caudoviricetes sp.]